MKSSTLRGLAIASSVLVMLVDRISKSLVESALAVPGQSVQVLGDALRFSYVRNYGVVFGIGSATRFSHRETWMVLLSVVAIGLLAVYFARVETARRCLLFGLALVLGGAIGNLVDRYRFGYVIDFIDVSLYFMRWWTFNVADAAICVGVGLMGLDLTARVDPKASPVPTGRSFRRKFYAGCGEVATHRSPEAAGAAGGDDRGAKARRLRRRGVGNRGPTGPVPHHPGRQRLVAAAGRNR